MDLTRRFPADLLARGLADWDWLPDLAGKTPIVTSIGGQIHRQVKDLPPGTTISGFTLEEEEPGRE